MFRKSIFSKAPENLTNDYTFKFTELSLEEVDNSINNICSDNKIKLSSTINRDAIKEKQQNFVKKLFDKPDPTTVHTVPQLINQCQRTDLFKHIKRDAKTANFILISKYIRMSNLEMFSKWKKFSINREIIDIENLISARCNESDINILVPNKYRLGNDIIPSYLLRKTKKSKEKSENKSKSEANKFSSLIKVFKAMKQCSDNETSICFIGSQKSGKSSIIGNILIYLNLLDRSFIKKTEWEAQKMNSIECKSAWLTDTLNCERLYKETILSSNHLIEINEQVINVIDTPGNPYYFEQLINSLLKSDHVQLIINAVSDWCKDSSDFIHIDYLTLLLRMLKIFKISALNIIIVNCKDEIELKIISRLQSIRKKIYKSGANLNFSCCKLKDLTNIQSTEIDLILEQLKKLKPVSRTVEVDKPVLMEILDIYKPVESSLPVIVARVLRGGVSSGVNNVFSKGIIVPEMITCTVKSMKLQEKNDWRTKSFAFPGNVVELTMPEINYEEKIKKCSYFCHPDFPLVYGRMFRVQMIIFDCDSISTPIIIGMKSFLWSKTRSCFCELKKLESCEYTENKQKFFKKYPRMVQMSGSIVVAEIFTDDVLAVELESMYKLDIFLLFSGLKMFAAGKFISII